MSAVSADPMAFLPRELRLCIWSFVAPWVRTRVANVVRLRQLSGLAVLSTDWYRLIVHEMSSFQARFILFPPLLGALEVGGLFTSLHPCPPLVPRVCYYTVLLL